MEYLTASVIIPTRNRAYILKYCLDCILKQDYDSYEVICIDDASEDETTELSSKFSRKLSGQSSKFKYIKLNERKGPYVARNIGIERAKGEIIIFIDSDVIVHPSFVAQHVLLHENRKQGGSTSGTRLINEKIWVQGMVHHMRNLKSSEFKVQSSKLKMKSEISFKFYYPNALCIGTFITQNVSVLKKYLLEVGGFDTFGSLIGYKDVDMGLRLRQIGLHPVHALFKCKAYHIDGPSTRLNLYEFCSKQESRGRSAYFFRERYGKLGKKFAHTEKALFISHFFQTDRWAECEGLKFLETSQDSPILPLFPLIKMLVKYHYRAKGILGVQSSKFRRHTCLLHQRVQSSEFKEKPLNPQPPTPNPQLLTPKASVIIATYNREKLLKYCLRQLLNQTTKDYEIIVIDDSSTDNTALLPEVKKVRYFKNPGQMGQPFSRNRGIGEAKGEIIIFVDSDVLVDKKFIQDHIEAHNCRDTARCVPTIVQGIVRHIRHPKDAGRFSLRIDGFSHTGLVTQNVSVKKKWLLKVGLMDEKFGITMGYEDTDLGRRLKKLGVKTVYGFKKCRAYHVDGYPTYEKFRASFQKREEWSKNIVYFGSKHGHRFVKDKKVFAISKLFQTDKWAEKEAALKFLVNNIDFPIFFITPILKEIMKYHYRAKGILEAQNRRKE